MGKSVLLPFVLFLGPRPRAHARARFFGRGLGRQGSHVHLSSCPDLQNLNIQFSNNVQYAEHPYAHCHINTPLQQEPSGTLTSAGVIVRGLGTPTTAVAPEPGRGALRLPSFASQPSSPSTPALPPAPRTPSFKQVVGFDVSPGAPATAAAAATTTSISPPTIPQFASGVGHSVADSGLLLPHRSISTTPTILSGATARSTPSHSRGGSGATSPTPTPPPFTTASTHTRPLFPSSSFSPPRPANAHHQHAQHASFSTYAYSNLDPAAISSMASTSPFMPPTAPGGIYTAATAPQPYAPAPGDATAKSGGGNSDDTGAGGGGVSVTMEAAPGSPRVLLPGDVSSGMTSVVHATCDGRVVGLGGAGAGARGAAAASGGLLPPAAMSTGSGGGNNGAAAQHAPGGTCR